MLFTQSCLLQGACWRQNKFTKHSTRGITSHTWTYLSIRRRLCPRKEGCWQKDSMLWRHERSACSQNIIAACYSLVWQLDGSKSAYCTNKKNTIVSDRELTLLNEQYLWTLSRTWLKSGWIKTSTKLEIFELAMFEYWREMDNHEKPWNFPSL